MATTMHDLGAPDLDWAHSTFMALDDPDPDSNEASTTWDSDKWPTFDNTQSPLLPSAFTMPPALLSEASVARYGQITPPEDVSPVDSRPHCNRREGSNRADMAWPIEERIQALADYQPQEEQGQTCTQEHEHEPCSKRRRTKQPAANQSRPAADADPLPPQKAHPTNPLPPKRKRGRPKSQHMPPTVEAFTHDGYPIHVASARQTHLEKNRVAAHKCRQRKKEYIDSLESRAREFSAKNKALKEGVALLREEVLQLKNEVLRHAGCGFWAVDEYLARCAGDLVGLDTSSIMGSRTHSQTQSPTLSSLVRQDEEHEGSVNSSTSQGTRDSNDDLDLFDTKLEMETPDYLT